MKHNATRFLSLLLALVMVVGLMPMGHVHAEEELFHVIGDQVTIVEANGTYVICIAGTKNALSNQQGSSAWSTHTLATGACDKIADARILWTLEPAEGGYKLKNESGYLNISRNSASLNETGHVFELVYHEGAGWAIKSLETNEYGNNLGDSGSIGGWSGDGTKFDLYTVNQAAAEEVDPFGKLRGFWSKVSVDTETSYDWKEGLFEYAFDSNPATIWHSNWQGASDKLTGENTFAGVIDFGAAYTINQFSFTPRQGNNSGQVTQASLYVKETEEAEWILVVEHATFAADQSKKDMDFEAQAVRYVKFVAEQSSDGWVAVSEFDVAYNAPAAHEHSYEAVITAPTCTEGGYTTYTCACGDTYVADETKALGHNDGPVVVENEKPSTCTEGGYYDAVCYCTVCGVETYRSHIVVGPDGHFPTVFPGYPATCTEPGLTDGKRCGVCLEWIEPQEEIPALGHTAVVIPGHPATCTEDGLTDGSYCSVCDATITAQEVIPATGHTPVSIPGYPATCEAPGMTDGSYCSVCDATITAQEVIPATGHTPVSIPGYPATCEAPGMTDGSYCSVCDATITAQEVIPALGHSYENGSCVNCGAADPNFNAVIATGWSGYTTWTLTADGVLTFVPSGEKLENGETNLKNYWKVNGVLSLPWGEYAEQITKVVVSEGIHDIGQMAFYELPNLTEVQLPSTIVEIRGYAFKNCQKLATINLENVDFIREGAFYGCAALENISFLTGVVIEDWAFSKTPVVLP